MKQGSCCSGHFFICPLIKDDRNSSRALMKGFTEKKPNTVVGIYHTGKEKNPTGFKAITSALCLQLKIYVHVHLWLNESTGMYV